MILYEYGMGFLRFVIRKKPSTCDVLAVFVMVIVEWITLVTPVRNTEMSAEVLGKRLAEGMEFSSSMSTGVENYHMLTMQRKLLQHTTRCQHTSGFDGRNWRHT